MRFGKFTKTCPSAHQPNRFRIHRFIRCLISTSGELEIFRGYGRDDGKEYSLGVHLSS